LACQAHISLVWSALSCVHSTQQLPAGLTGLDADGRPVDARNLFDKEVLEKTVLGILKNYYKGFTGTSYLTGVPFDMDTLVEGMIEEMGVDRHMEETIRVADQQALTDRAFRAFLMERGVESTGIASFQRGVADIVIHSGPLLGAFNAGISIPELIEASACMAAVCVARHAVKLLRYPERHWIPDQVRHDRVGYLVARLIILA